MQWDRRTKWGKTVVWGDGHLRHRLLRMFPWPARVNTCILRLLHFPCSWCQMQHWKKHCKQIWKSNFKQQNATEMGFVITASASRKQGLLIYRPSYCQGLRQSNLWCKSQERFLDSQRSHILMTAKCIGFSLSLSKVAGKLFLQVHSSERNCKWAGGLRDGEGVGGRSRRQSL